MERPFPINLDGVGVPIAGYLGEVVFHFPHDGRRQRWLAPAFVGSMPGRGTAWSETMPLALSYLILYHIGMPCKAGVLD